MDTGDKYPLDNLIWNQQIMMIMDRLLSAIMLAAFCIPLIMVITRVQVNWQGWYVIPVVFIIAVESMYSHYRMRGVSIAGLDWWLYRFAEFIVIAILLKLLLYGLRGFSQFFIDLSLWRENIFSFFSDPEYFLLLLFAVCIWVISGELDAEFFLIEGDEKLLRVELDTGFSEQRVQVRQRLANAIILGGGVMIVLVGLTNLESGTTWLATNLTRQGVIAILIYFICGLCLLSLTQFSILRVRWVINHVQIGRKVTTRWFTYSILLVLGLTVLAFLLPTGYSSQILTVLQLGLGYLFLAIQFIIYFLTLPFILLFTFIMSLFKKPVNETALPRIKPVPPVQFASYGPTPSWLEILKTVVLVLSIMGLVGYAFYYYFKEHPEYFSWMRRSGSVIRFSKFWRSFFKWFRGVNGRLVQSVRGRLEAFRLHSGEHVDETNKRVINPRRMTPRQQVLFYYLAMIRRGTQAGLSRPASQTPIEYSERLIKYLSETPNRDGLSPTDVPEDISVLTQEFIQARYSQHQITNSEVGLVRRTWERISRVIRRSKKTHR